MSLLMSTLFRLIKPRSIKPHSIKSHSIRPSLRLLGHRMPLPIIVLAVSTAVVSPFYFSRIAVPGQPGGAQLISTHDMAEHLIVMEEFDKVLRSGVVYPRWFADANKGYGSAWPNFYPPGFYYLTSVVHTIIADWVNTLLIVSVLVLALSFLAFYALSRTFYGRFPSIAGAALYLLWPYHLLNLYWRGAMPEFAGFALAPLIVLFAYRLAEHSMGKYYAGLGLSYGALILIHFPGGYLVGWAVALYGLLLGLEKRDWKTPLRIWSGMGIGLLVASIYWLPAAIEEKDAYENISAIFPYAGSYLPFFRPLGDFGGLLNRTLAAQIIALLATLMVLWSLRRRPAQAPQDPSCPSRPNQQEGTSSFSRAQVRPFVVLALITTLMCTALSAPISGIMPRIQLVGFPCRWLAISGLFTALLVGAAIERLMTTTRAGKTRIKLWTGAAVLAAVTVLNVGFTIGSVMVRALSNPLLKIIPEGLIEPNYTPKNSMPPNALPDVPFARLVLEGGSALVTRWKPDHREILEESGVQNFLRLRSYYFPGWIARIDDHPAKMIGDGAGMQLILVPPGKHKVEVFLVDTPARTFGALCSAFGLVLICILALVPGRFFTRPHWISRKRILLRDKSGQQDETQVEPVTESAALKESANVEVEKKKAHRRTG
jgi:hypothetical protein